MKKLTKKNNKGFSLVELIVVVLIMAIIAVALAPQVTKWVEKSRHATDAQNYDTIISALQIANAEGDIKTSGQVTVASGKWAITAGSVDGDLDNQLGADWEEDLKPRSSSAAYVIDFNTNGVITRTTPPTDVSND